MQRGSRRSAPFNERFIWHVRSMAGSLGSGAYDSSSRCVFPIVVRGVPDGSTSYSVQVGWHGKKRITNEQARTGNLVMQLG